MCSYRDRLPKELSVEEISGLADGLFEFGLKRIVYSGGEPLLRRDLPKICEIFQRGSIKQTLLTNGILLKHRIHQIADFIDEVIVSLDGATAPVQNAIRGVDSFSKVVEAIPLLKQVNPKITVSIRSVLQKKNFFEIPELVNLGLRLDVDRVSFLAVDIFSEAFGRSRATRDNRGSLMLNADEVRELRRIIHRLSVERADLFEAGFLSESPDRLMQIADYFEAFLNGEAYPPLPCNAPMVSAVITSTGEFLPCYFLPSVGNIRERSIRDLVNCKAMLSTRSSVRQSSLERCQTCVCRLKVPSYSALLGSF